MQNILTAFYSKASLASKNASASKQTGLLANIIVCL